MPTTSGGLRYPASSDAVNVPGDLQNLADDVDTAKAPKESPALTGTPTAPTASADTNTTQVATTAYVIGQAASATPAAVGTAAVGTSTRFARADHRHADSTAVTLDTRDSSTSGIPLHNAGKVITCTNTSNISIGLSEDAWVNFPVGSRVDFIRMGTGEVEFAVTGGASILSEGSKKRINAQYQAVTAIKTASNQWLLIGALKT